MNLIEEDAPPVRPMGIVAGRTAGIGNRVIHVLFDKTGPVCLVATDAEGGDLSFEESIGGGGSMGVMATCTSLLHRVVFEFDF